jgi:hypothetical protein
MGGEPLSKPQQPGNREARSLPIFGPGQSPKHLEKEMGDWGLDGQDRKSRRTNMGQRVHHHCLAQDGPVWRGGGG